MAQDLAVHLDTLRARMTTLSMDIARVEDDLKTAREAERTISVRDAICDLVYDTIPTVGIRVRGSFTDFTVAGRTYDIGNATLPMTVFLRAKVCKLSEYMREVFQAPGSNIFEKVRNFLSGKWDDLSTYDLYTFAIDTDARPRGRKKFDISNVNFAVTMLFLTKLPDHDFVVSDTIHSGTDTSVRIVNYSHVLRRLHDMRVRVQTCKNSGDASNGLDVILYQRRTGEPDEKVTMAIHRATGLQGTDVMHMHLVPVKESVGMGGNCYKDFATSAGLILHQLSVLDEYCRVKGKQYINDIKFVLDPFSGYAAYTAVSILGYGVDNMFHVIPGR